MLHDPRPTLARGIGFLADRLTPAPRGARRARARARARRRRARADPGAADGRVEPPRSPLRDPVVGTRTEVRFDGAAALALDPAGVRRGDPAPDLPEAGELRRPAEPMLIDPAPIDDVAVEPAADPVVGSELAAARTRLGLTVDQLAERTRIRPHVIESIEVDDFAPCGGDFYARGHLRTLARVLGVDAAPLLDVVRRAVRRRPDRRPPGLRGRARDRRRRPDPRHPRRSELVGPGRRRDGDRAGLVDRPAGHGQPDPARRPAGAQRLAVEPDQARPAGAGAARRVDRRRPRRGPRRRRPGRLQRRPRLRRHPDRQGRAAGAGAVLGRRARREHRRQGPRPARHRGPAGVEHVRRSASSPARAGPLVSTRAGSVDILGRL